MPGARLLARLSGRDVPLALGQLRVRGPSAFAALAFACLAAACGDIATSAGDAGAIGNAPDANAGTNDGGVVDGGMDDGGMGDGGVANTCVTPSSGTYGGGGTTHYVAPTGSNGAAGDLAHPWASLAYACSQVTTAGDVIHLGAGTYGETARCDLAVGVSIEGSGIDATKISTTYAAPNSSDGAIRLNSATYTNGNQSISQLSMDGSGLVATRAIDVNYRNNVSVHHVKITNFKASAAFFRGSTTAWNVEPTTYASGNRLHDSIINNNSTRSETESAHIRINGQSDFMLCNTQFDQTARPAGENGNILGGEWNRALGMFGNTFTKNDYEASQWGFFFELWHWEGGGEIYDNTFHGAATMDIVDVRKGTYPYGLKIYRNNYLVAANVPQSIHRTQSINLEERGHIQYVYMYDNYFKNVPNALWIDAILQEGTWVYVDHIYFYSNLIENAGCTDLPSNPIWINGYGGNPSITFDTISIYNNTLTGTSSVKGYNGIGWNATGTFKNIQIRNNIIQGFGGPAIRFDLGLAGATVDALSIENNLYFANSTNGATFAAGVAVTNKADQNNVVGNPLFVSATDFHLQAASPAVNAGLDMGLPFQGAAPDIGRYESTF